MRALTMAGLALVAALAVAQPAVAQGVADWRESPQFFIPGEIVAGEQTYAEDEVIALVPLRWKFAARLEQAVTARFEDDEVTFSAGALLPAVYFSANGAQESGEMAYCTPRRTGSSSDLEAGLTTFLAGGVLGEMLRNSLNDKQLCLQDSDADGLLDASLMVGSGKDDYTRGDPIAPVPFQLANGEEISPRDFIRLTLHKVRNRNIEIKLDLVQQGSTQNAGLMRSGFVYGHQYTNIDLREAYPGNVSIFGMRFGVTGHDAAANTATLVWAEKMPVEQVTLEYPFTTTVYFPED